MDTFRRRLGPALALVSLMTMLAACEENTAPIITKFRVSPECLNITEHTDGTFAEVQFFARASGGNEESDPTGGNTPLSWEWNFGDGTTLTNVVTGFHKYFEPGEYTVKLTVKDKDGEVATDEISIVVGAIGDELDILSVDVTFTRDGQYQSTFNTSGLTSCTFRAWHYDLHGVLDTPCIINGLTEQYEWRWQHGNAEILHESDLQQDYLYPGPHTDKYFLTVTEISSQTARMDSLEVIIPAEELQLASLTGASITSAPVPKFANNAGTCEFVGWDIVLSGAAATQCGTLMSASQYQWDWTFSDGSTQANLAQVARTYLFDPQNPGESSDSASLRITETLTNPGGQTQDLVMDDSIQYVIPGGPVTTIRKIDLDLVDLEPDPRRSRFVDPIWDEVDDGQGGFTCEFVGWDVFYDVSVLTGCGPTEEATAQFQWDYDYGDGTQATDPVGTQRHRYFYDADSPGSRNLTTVLTITDKNTGVTAEKTVPVNLPEAPNNIPSPCPDNVKH